MTIIGTKVSDRKKLYNSRYGDLSHFFKHYMLILSVLLQFLLRQISLYNYTFKCLLIDFYGIIYPFIFLYFMWMLALIEAKESVFSSLFVVFLLKNTIKRVVFKKILFFNIFVTCLYFRIRD
jgi:hypothetical protein